MLRIAGTGRAIPNRLVSNDELAEFLDTGDEWIVSKTGIHSRRVCTEEGITDLSEKCARTALERAGLKPSDLDLVICSTISADYVTPSLACCVAERLGTSCPAFDINAACSGFVYLLDIAAAYFASGKAENILIVSADAMSSKVDWTDRSMCILFGDGAGACAVKKGDAVKYLNLTAQGDTKTIRLPSGTGNSPFIKRKEKKSFLEWDGPEVFKFAVSSVLREVNLALARLDLTPDKVDYFILHQANKRIIDSVRKRLNQPEDKFPVNIEKYGNSSSATIPVLLDEMVESGKIKKGSLLLFSAFGAGLATGTCVMIWQ